MSLNKLQIRTLIFYEWKKGTSTNDTARSICDVFGSDMVTQRTVQNWFKKFKSGDFELEDKEMK
jgi:hypothetical protein